MLAIVRTLRPRNFPDSSSASSASLTWSRPWASEMKPSLRSLTHLIGLLDLAGRPGEDRLFGVEELLDAEAAADIRRHDPELVLRDVEDEVAHQQLDDVWELARRPEREVLAGRVIFGDRGAGLHRVADQAVVDEADAGDMRRPGECRRCRLGVAALPIEARVVWNLVEDRRGARPDRVEHADDCRQRLVLHLDRFDRLAGLLEAIGDHKGDRVADAAHLADRERGVGRLLHRRTVDVGDPPAARDAVDIVGGEVGAGEDGDDARHRGSRRGIDRLEVGMGVMRAQEHAEGHVPELHVGDVVALAGEEALVFLAEDRRADACLARHARVPRAGVHRGRPVEDGGDDVLVARAAADVALEPVPHVAFGRRRIAPGEIDGAHHHAGRAEAALQPVVPVESLLHRVERALFAAGRGARPSMVVTAAPSVETASIVQLLTETPSTWTTHAPHCDVSQPMCGAGEVEVLAQQVGQKQGRIDVNLHPTPVHCYADVHFRFSASHDFTHLPASTVRRAFSPSRLPSRPSPRRRWRTGRGRKPGPGRRR